MNFNEWKHFLLILVIFIAACIETDIYLPAFTDMMNYFSVNEETIQSLLTWNFAGMCLVGPLYGPLSDALGRRKPLLLALTLFLVGSLITMTANNFSFMLVGRVLQGLGSGGCFTLGTAIIFDSFQEKQAINAINKLNTFIPFIMAGAPMLGGFLNQEFGFKSNFLVIALFVLASLLITFFFYKESHPKESRTPLAFGKILGEFKKIGASLPFWQMGIVLSLMFAGYLAFLSGISVLFVLELGVTKQQLPYFQLSLLAAWLAGNLLCHRVVMAFGVNNVKKMGTLLTGIGGLVLALSAWLIPANAYIPTLGMVIYCFGVNWINGIYFPEIMELFPESKGTAASLVSSARLLLTAAVVGISGNLYDGTIYPLAGVVLSVIIVILTTIFFYEKRRGDRLEVLMTEPIVEVF